MVVDLPDFDPASALDYACQISKPRLVGTEQEKAVGGQVAAWLESFGYQVTRQDFEFADAQSIVLSFEILLSQALVLITIGLGLNHSPARTVSALLLLILIALTSAINRAVQNASLKAEPGEPAGILRSLCWRIGKRYNTCNYFAQMPGASSDPSRTQLLLVAHYDSKSQRYPLTLRILLFMVGIGGGALCAVLMLLSPLYPPLGNAALWIGGLTVLAGIPLLFLDQGNKSPGAIDNASGIGVVLNMAEGLAHHPEIKASIDVAILITSAEEFSTLGALAFVRQNEEVLQCQANAGRLYVLNFDGPGVDGGLYWVGKDASTEPRTDPALAFLVRQACKELGYPLGKFVLPGALFDHMPFADRGYDAGSLVAISRASLTVHTPQDDVEQLHPRGFEQTSQVVLQIIQKLQKLPAPGSHLLNCGMKRSDLYRVDPFLTFLRDRMGITPKKMLFATLALGVADLLIAKSYGLWQTHLEDGKIIIGALQDPPFLLTIFIILPLFLRTYIWMPDGMWSLFQSLPRNHLVREQDLKIYQSNVDKLVHRYNRNWLVITVLGAFVIQAVVVIFNELYKPEAYNTLLTARLVFFRIPYGLLALYGATAVVLRTILNGDWSLLTRDIEPLINPLHPDQSAGFGAFTNYIINILGIFIGIAAFFFTQALFSYQPGAIRFETNYKNIPVIASSVVYLIVGFYVFLYIPTGAARRAIMQAKRRQMNIIAERYNAEREDFLRDVKQPVASQDQSQATKAMRDQIERLKLLNETMNVVENVPSTPINRRTLQRFGLSYISVYLSAIGVNLIRAFSTDQALADFQMLLQSGSFLDILRGLVSIFFTGKI